MPAQFTPFELGQIHTHAYHGLGPSGGRAESMGHGPLGLVLNESARSCFVLSTKPDRDSWDSLNFKKKNFEILLFEI